MVLTLLEVNARGARRILAVENDGMMNLIIGDGLDLQETILVEGAGMMDRSAKGSISFNFPLQITGLAEWLLKK